MDENLSKLKKQIEKIEALKGTANWGPEFQLWKNTTEKLVQELFGEDGLKLFQQQRTRTTSYISNEFNVGQYLKELENRKKILEGLLGEMEEHQSSSGKSVDASDDVLKEIWRKEEALKENLLPTSQAESLHKSLLTHLEKTLPSDSLPGLRFKKLRAGKPITWWSTEAGYPIDNPWEKFKPFLELLEQYEAGKTIKRRLETEGLFVESRAQGSEGDLHLLVGEKNHTGEKAHIIIDSKTGEIRTEDGRKEPTEIAARIEAILTLPNGKKIKSTREAIEEITETPSKSSKGGARIDLASNFGGSGGPDGTYLMFSVKNDGNESALDVQAELVANDCSGAGSIDVTHNLSPGKQSNTFAYRYDGTDFFKRKLDNPRIIFRYKSVDGRSFASGRGIIQDKRADNNYNINTKPGNYFEE